MTESKDRTVHFANLSWTKAQEILEGPRKPVILFPLGSTEAHGPHLPVSTDPIISLGMCRRAAHGLRDDPEIRPLILPPVQYGVTRYANGFPGTIHVNEDTLHSLIVDVCSSLIGHGFRYVVLVNNHFEPEHVRTIHRALDSIQTAVGVTPGYIDLTRKERARRLTNEFWRVGSHAGQYETSLVLADEPGLVDQAAMKTLPDVDVNLVDAISRGVKEFRAMGLDRAYNGSSARATAEEGEASYAILTTMLIETMRDVARGTGGRDLPGLYSRV